MHYVYYSVKFGDGYGNFYNHIQNENRIIFKVFPHYPKYTRIFTPKSVLFGWLSTVIDFNG